MNLSVSRDFLRAALFLWMIPFVTALSSLRQAKRSASCAFSSSPPGQRGFERLDRRAQGGLLRSVAKSAFLACFHAFNGGFRVRHRADSPPAVPVYVFRNGNRKNYNRAKAELQAVCGRTMKSNPFCKDEERMMFHESRVRFRVVPHGFGIGGDGSRQSDVRRRPRCSRRRVGDGTRRRHPRHTHPHPVGGRSASARQAARPIRHDRGAWTSP